MNVLLGKTIQLPFTESKSVGNFWSSFAFCAQKIDFSGNSIKVYYTFFFIFCLICAVVCPSVTNSSSVLKSSSSDLASDAEEGPGNGSVKSTAVGSGRGAGMVASVLGTAGSTRGLTLLLASSLLLAPSAPLWRYLMVFLDSRGILKEKKQRRQGLSGRGRLSGTLRQK